MKREVARQITHLFLGFLAIELVLFFGKTTALVSMVFLLFSALVVSLLVASGANIPFLRNALTHMQRKNEVHLPGRAVLVFLISLCLILSLFYFSSQSVLLAALLVLSVGDSCSSIFGTAFGKTVVAKRRTLEGTVAGIVFSFAFVLLLYNPYKAFLIALFGMLAEYFPIEDNFSIPIVAGTAALLLP